ncbi:hypothetical protein D3C76_771340 [compost metagenome]
MHTDKTVGAGDDHFAHIAHATDRQWLHLQFTQGIGHGLFAQHFFTARAAHQRRQFGYGGQFDEAVDRNTAAELFTQTQEHARQQD